MVPPRLEFSDFRFDSLNSLADVLEASSYIALFFKSFASNLGLG